MEKSLSERKRHHLNVCLDPSYEVESGDTALDRIAFPHRCMPEIDSRQVTLAADFIGMKLDLPLLVSCMTGGTNEGRRYNFLLAAIAAERKIAIGTGSIRIMLKDPDTLSHFQMKSLASNVPVLANIGAAQLLEYPPETITEAVKRIQADGLYIHLNPAQEFFQRHGERDFSGWFDAIRRLLDCARFPVLVKETGCGIPPSDGLRLLKAGAAYVDIAGSGGTDWIAVETHLQDIRERSAGESFRRWGYPTGLILLAYRAMALAGGEAGNLISGRLIASGGLRIPRDFALAMACGASMTAAALPFIRRASYGSDEVHDFIDSIDRGLKAALVLTGAGSFKKLRDIPLRIPPDLEREANILAADALSDE
ncbi:MAG: type 2 isopentenyl-diphosphate Delta-isomerase [spirochete symbiont of Stewartia floridana]|nr:MAG: type 2 isopentenyl-diphosphate Delta-isomerase [spirochete symbiont of Stewartia floridana]